MKIRTMMTALWLGAYLKKLEPLRKEVFRLRRAGDAEGERKVLAQLVDTWSSAVLEHLRIDHRPQYEAPIPEGPVVFVANHQSFLDIPVIGATLRGHQTGFIAKSDLKKVPLYGQWIADIRSLYLEREDSREALLVMKEGIALLEQGFSLTLFPEGTRGEGPEMSEFKYGSFRLAFKPGVPIVPITVCGSYYGYEAQMEPRPVRVDVFVHKAVPTAGLSKAEQKETERAVEACIRAKLEELQRARQE